MKVLIGCEESQTICGAFRENGHEAYSCDLQECSGGHPEWHIQDDVLNVIDSEKWDLMIAHPPCTHLAVSGAAWFAEKRKDGRQQEAIDFFMAIANTNIPKTCIENPVCIMSTIWRKPDQYIQPYEYGHAASKKTALWLKELPKLTATNIVDKGEYYYYKSGKSMSKWYADTRGLPKAERAKIRSKTFPGIAKAMAEQWDKI